MTEPSAEVEGYIASLPAPMQALVGEIRAAVLAGAPGAAERISYQIPAVTLDGTSLVYFGGWKRHVGLYPVPTLPAGLESQGRPVPIQQGDREVPAGRSAARRPGPPRGRGARRSASQRGPLTGLEPG